VICPFGIKEKIDVLIEVKTHLLCPSQKRTQTKPQLSQKIQRLIALPVTADRKTTHSGNTKSGTSHNLNGTWIPPSPKALFLYTAQHHAREPFMVSGKIKCSSDMSKFKTNYCILKRFFSFATSFHSSIDKSSR